MLSVQVIHASDSFDKERVPKGFSVPPIVAVVLPGAHYSQMIAKQTRRSFDYHLLTNFDYNMFSPIDFDADTFVEECLEYCKAQGVHGVVALDCFPVFLGAILRQELGLPGPSFDSVLHCCNKYYMRRNVTTSEVYTPGAPPPSYPCVVKVADTQFYSAVRIVYDEAGWRAAWKSFEELCAKGGGARKRFYYKWATHFGVTLEARWEDVVLIFTEPYYNYKTEHQVEVVVTADGKMLLADTGDVVHMKGGDNITMFKTPADMEMTPILLKWIHTICSRLIQMGYKSAPLDLEFMRIDAAEEQYEVCEINSRYSYMGDWVVPSPKLLCDSKHDFTKTFLLACTSLTQSNRAEDIVEAIDADGDKQVSPEEMQVIINKLKLSDSQQGNVAALMEVLDKDGDGKVAVAELRGPLQEVLAERLNERSVGTETMEVRNLLNRSRLALGFDPSTLPCRDKPGAAKIAAAVFTNRLGDIKDIFNAAVIDGLVKDRTLESWQPEPPVINGGPVESDLIYGGWARLGYMIMTWEDNLSKINQKLDEVIKSLFVRPELGGYLMIRHYREQPVPLECKPRYDMLLRFDEVPTRAPQGCFCVCS